MVPITGWGIDPNYSSYIDSLSALGLSARSLGAKLVRPIGSQAGNWKIPIEVGVVKWFIGFGIGQENLGLEQGTVLQSP